MSIIKENLLFLVTCVLIASIDWQRVNIVRILFASPFIHVPNFFPRCKNSRQLTAEILLFSIEIRYEISSWWRGKVRVRKINYSLVTEEWILDSEKSGTAVTFTTFAVQPCRHSLLVAQRKYFLIVQQSCEMIEVMFVGHSDTLKG